MCHVFSPTRDELQRWSQSFDQLMRSPRTYAFSTYFFSTYFYLKPNYITLSMSSSLGGRRPVRDQIPLDYPACDQFASRSATSSRAASRAASSCSKTFVCKSCACRRPNSITLSSLRSARAGRKLDSVMEYGLSRSATRCELSRHVEIAGTCLRQVGNQVCDQVCDLDSIMKFSQSRSQTSSQTSSRARSRAR